MKRIIGLYYFIFFVAVAATSEYLTLYLRTKGLDSAQIGLLLAAGSAAGIFAQPIVGLINDRAHDPRQILILSAVLSPVVYAGYALFHGFWPLVAVSVVLAAVQSAAPIVDSIAIHEGERAGLSYGKVRLRGALGFAAAVAVAGVAYHAFGLGTSFWVYGGLSVGLLAITFRLPRAGHASVARGAFWHGLWTIVRRRPLLLFLGACFLMSCATTVNLNFLPLYYQDLHYPMRWVGLNYTVAALIEVPLFYVSGRIMARFGLMRTLIGGAAFYVVKYFLMSFVLGYTVVIALQLFDGIAFALFWSASVQVVARLAPASRQATAQTLYGAVASLGSIVGASGGGFVLNRFGPLVLYAVTAGTGGLAILGFVAFTLTNGRALHANEKSEGVAV